MLKDSQRLKKIALLVDEACTVSEEQMAAMQVTVCRFESDVFANREMCLTVPRELAEAFEHIVIFLRYSGDANAYFIKLLLLVRTVQSLNNKAKISLIMPYLPYSRQDKSTNAVSAMEILLQQLLTLGLFNIAVYDVHNPTSLGQCGLAIDNIRLEYFYAQLIRRLNLNASVIIAPDEGSKPRAEKIASLLGCESAYFIKQRCAKGKVEVRVADKQINFSKKDCIIVDDILHSCSTIAGVAKYLKDFALGSMYCCATHADFTIGAVEMLESLGFNEVYVTDSIEIGCVDSRILKVVSVEHLLYEYFERLNRGNNG